MARPDRLYNRARNLGRRPTETARASSLSWYGSCRRAPCASARRHRWLDGRRGGPGPAWFATLGEAEQAALRQASTRDTRVFLHDRYHRVRPLFARRLSRSAATLPRRGPRYQARGARRGASARPRGRSGSRGRAGRRRRAPPRSPARRRGAAAAVGIEAASSTASISSRDRDRLVGVLRARLDEDPVHGRVMARAARAAAPHCHQPALGQQLRVARRPDAGLDPDPALGEQRRPARASRPRRG